MNSYEKVIIRDLELDMYIGIYDHEKENKQRVIVNLDIEVKKQDYKDVDDYSMVFCYETIINEIQDLAAQGHINLVETFAQKITELCLAKSLTKSVRVNVQKPDIIDKTTGVGFEALVHKSD